MSQASSAAADGPSPAEQKLLFLLAVVQFCNVLDFLIMMPLGPQYMRVFSISPRQFGFIVSSYAISAGVSGVAGSLFLDRFDRRKALLVLFSGFAVGTFFCAIAPGYLYLMAARTVAGAFGGLTGATVLAIVGDVVPEFRRGRAMGMVMSSFSVAMICGVPAGLFLANHFGWHAPFLALSGLSVVILGLASRILPPLQAHLGRTRAMFDQLGVLLGHWNHLRALATIALMTCAGFMVIPYISPYMVKNVGLKETELPYIYFFGGLCTLFTMNLIGRMADRFGKFRMFAVVGVLSFFPTIWLSRLGPSSLVLAVAVCALVMISTSGRFVPMMALLTGSVQRRHRGAFMSLTSAVQHFSAGCAASASGAIMGQAVGGQITHYDWSGYLSVGLALLSIILGSSIRPAVEEA